VSFVIHMNHPFLCRSVLGVVHFTFIISALVNLTNMFGNCFNGTDKKKRGSNSCRSLLCSLVNSCDNFEWPMIVTLKLNPKLCNSRHRAIHRSRSLSFKKILKTGNFTFYMSNCDTYYPFSKTFTEISQLKDFKYGLPHFSILLFFLDRTDMLRRGGVRKV
jgi:hypothetical protein